MRLSPRPITTTARGVITATLVALAGLGTATAPARAALSVLTPSPASWEFGNGDIHRFVGSPSENFTFTNNAGGEVNVANVSIVGPDASDYQLGPENCSGAWLGQGSSCAVQVAFNPGQLGTKTASLELDDDSGTIDIPLLGTGIVGALNANPNPIVFTSQPWFEGGQQQTLSIQDSNDAGAAATSATITGPDASDFNIAWGQNCSNQLYGPGSTCGMGVGFNPPNGPGVFNAQLELTSDGTSGPVIIPLTATSLSGPHTVISPTETNFGSVEIGQSVSKAITVSNEGDYPMQIQQAFMVTGSQSALSVTADGCTGQIVNPGSSCQFTVRFQPDAVGYRDGGVVLINNSPEPVTPVAFEGTGVPSLNGAATITGAVSAGNTLTCNPVGFPDGTTYAYQWLANGQPVAGADTQTLELTDGNVGEAVSCRVGATNPVSAQTVTSPPTAPTGPMMLDNQPGSLIGEGTCRVLDANAALRLGRGTVWSSYGRPTTPWAPLTLTSTAAFRVLIDGRTVGGGRTVNVSPRTLSQFADGSHVLRVTNASGSTSGSVLLAPCLLAVRLNGDPSQSAVMSASSRYGMHSLTMHLPKGLDLNLPAGGLLGTATVQPAGSPVWSFDLFRAHTNWNGIAVALTRHTVTISNLPTQTGLVTVAIRAGLLVGHGGTVTLTAQVRGAGAPLQAQTPVNWLP